MPSRKQPTSPQNPFDGTPAKARSSYRQSLPKVGDAIYLEKQAWALSSERWAHLPARFSAEVKGYTNTGIRLEYEDPITGHLLRFRVSKVWRPNSSFRWSLEAPGKGT